MLIRRIKNPKFIDTKMSLELGGFDPERNGRPNLDSEMGATLELSVLA